MNYYETITKYLPKAVDKYFAAESKSVVLENGAKFIDVNFNESGYVKIADFLLDGLSNYYRTQEQPDALNPLPGYGSGYGYPNYAAYAGNNGEGVRDGFAIGGTTVRWEIYKLQWCRGRQFRIDHISDEETGKIVTGGLIEEFHRLKVIPEVDACRFSVIADSASVSLGNLKVNETITATDESTGIIHRFNDAFEWLTEHEVPSEMQAIFVNPGIMTLIRNTAELRKFLTQEDFRNANGLDFTVEKYMGRPIIEVPSSRFFTNIVVTENGFMATPSVSKQIQYMICSMKAVVPIRKIEYSKIYGEDQAGIVGFYGSMMNYLLYHGVVIPKNKLVGTYVSVGSAGSALGKTNVLSVDIREGVALNSWRLNAEFTAPSGLRGLVVYSLTNQFVVGQSVTITAEGDRAESYITGTEVWPVVRNQEVVDATNTQLYFALVDYRGICIAKSTQVTLVKKTA